MELELKQTEATGYDNVYETTLFSEETLECIVPDSCPDILRIVDCSGTVCVKGRETENGHAEIRGTVHVCVLYMPDGAQQLKHMDVTIPFLCSTDHSSIRKDGILHAVPRLLGADARLLNPRKIYVRTEIAMGVQIFAPSAGVYTVGLETETGWGIEEKKDQCRFYGISTVQEKNFTYSDELTLPPSKPDVEEILSCRVEPVCGEHKIIGSKLILKGQVVLSLLYLGSDHSLTTAVFELPFSQIMEISQLAEEADCTLNLFLADGTCQLTGEDVRTVAVTLDLTAQAVLRKEYVQEILTDLYSTAYLVELEKTTETVCSLCECGNRRVSVREVLDAPIAVKSVADCRLTIGEVLRKWDGSVLHLSADVRAAVIYIGEDDSLYALTRPLTVECQVNGEGAEECTCSCRCTGELYATPTVGGVELRFPLDFEYRTQSKGVVVQITSARLDEGKAYDSTCHPSIVLRLAEDGETLWDLAKAYMTTMHHIMTANELTEESELTGRLLLIPKKR